MAEQSGNRPPTLAYATRQTPAAVGDALLMGMRTWRRYTAWGLLGGFIALGFGWLALLFLAFVLFASVMTLVWMTRYAAHNLDKGYATRHLILAILLAPILPISALLISRVVEADIERYHLMANRTPATEDPPPS